MFDPPIPQAQLGNCRTCRGFTLVELMTVIAILGILSGLGLKAVQSMRASAQKTTCSNHLRQVGIGVTNFQSGFQHLPIGVRSIDDARFPRQSWLVQILPFVEQSSLFERSASSFALGLSPFYHPETQVAVAIYGCPADGRSGQPQWTHGPTLIALTSYVGVCGLSRNEPSGVLCYNQKIRPGDIVDGLSSTLLAGERPPSPDNWYGWWYVGAGQDGTGNPEMIMGVRETNLQNQNAEDCPTGPYHYTRGSFHDMCDVFHFWSPHPGGANFVYCDGSVKFLSYDADEILPALATRAGREVVTE